MVALSRFRCGDLIGESNVSGLVDDLVTRWLDDCWSVGGLVFDERLVKTVHLDWCIVGE